MMILGMSVLNQPFQHQNLQNDCNTVTKRFISMMDSIYTCQTIHDKLNDDS